MSKGFVFSLDSLIASMVLLMSLSLLFFSFNAFALQNLEQSKQIEKELLGLALSEAIVKNRNSELPSHGAAYFNFEKKRVEANVIDPGLLKRIKYEEFGKYILAGLYLRDSHTKKYYFNESNGKCLAIERFVVLKELIPRKTILGVVVCEK